MTVEIRCTHEDCPMPNHTAPTKEAAKAIGAAHYRHKGHAIVYDDGGNSENRGVK